MATVNRPSTPLGHSSSTVSTPQTGTWMHPRFDEIARRQNASTFSERDLKRIIYNGGGLFLLWLMEKLSRANFPTLCYAADSLRPYSTYLHLLLQIVLLLNIFFALQPLVARKDDLADIPLTPAQRRLLGLPPSETPPPAGSQYVTPPRYPRSATPQSGSPTAGYSASPISGKGSSTRATPNGSPFSANASPLLNKAIGGFNGAMRSSYGSPSPLGPGSSRGNWFDGPSTPSPTTSKGPSVTLNSKWLWEKTRRRSGDARVFS